MDGLGWFDVNSPAVFFRLEKLKDCEILTGLYKTFKKRQAKLDIQEAGEKIAAKYERKVHDKAERRLLLAYQQKSLSKKQWKWFERINPNGDVRQELQIALWEDVLKHHSGKKETHPDYLFLNASTAYYKYHMTDGWKVEKKEWDNELTPYFHKRDLLWILHGMFWDGKHTRHMKPYDGFEIHQKKKLLEETNWEEDHPPTTDEVDRIIKGEIIGGQIFKTWENGLTKNIGRLDKGLENLLLDREKFERLSDKYHEIKTARKRLSIEHCRFQELRDSLTKYRAFRCRAHMQNVFCSIIRLQEAVGVRRVNKTAFHTDDLQAPETSMTDSHFDDWKATPSKPYGNAFDRDEMFPHIRKTDRRKLGPSGEEKGQEGGGESSPGSETTDLSFVFTEEFSSADVQKAFDVFARAFLKGEGGGEFV
jgi:hypothetical protein